MSEYQKICTVRRVDHPGAGIFRLRLEAPEIAAAARPGQFVMAACGVERDPLLRRPFSVHDVTEDGGLDLLIREVGRGTALLAALRAGERVSVLGPLGRGFSLPGESEQGEIALVGGGIGTAPLLFLARRLLERGRAAEGVHVLVGAAHAAEARILREDFLELGCPVHISTDDGSLGHHGFVTELLPLLPAGINRICACGPRPMMAAAARFAEARGIACEVSLETRMACGLGACLGCAVPVPGEPNRYRHVCKDGPVFNAREVDWT